MPLILEKKLTFKNLLVLLKRDEKNNQKNNNKRSGGAWKKILKPMIKKI